MSIKNCRWLRCGTLAIAGLIVSRLPMMAQQLPHSASPSQQKNSANTERSVAQKLPAVHLDGTYFTRDGKRFIPVGAHWVPAKAAMQWPVRVGSARTLKPTLRRCTNSATTSPAST